MISLLLLAALGHAFIWVALANRSHAVGWPQRLVHWLTFVMFALAAGIPVAIAWEFYRAVAGWTAHDNDFVFPSPVNAYMGLCWIAGVWAILQWGWRVLWPRRRPERSSRSRVSQLVPAWDEAMDRAADACLMARLPGNESLCLEEVDRFVELARLPRMLSAISILHLSDIHMTGLIGKWYFAEVVRMCNLRQPDLVALTGDFVDEDACIDWVPETLCGLKARYGVYFVLGNHDRRVDSQRLRNVLVDGGLVDLGGRFLEIEIRGERLVLAGNEVPWFVQAADFRSAPPSSLHGGPVRVVLAHSPDQLPWARRNDVDLLLAGHTHGGQVCLPLVGPIFTPCMHGVRYTRGIYATPPTTMHVSKGVSAEIPLRFGALPEAAMLVLQSPRSAREVAPGSAGTA
jgi:predicted MPP superfamily phosphohydrolase